MFGLSADQTAHIIQATMASVLLATCATLLWLHRHRHLIRGCMRKALSHL